MTTSVNASLGSFSFRCLLSPSYDLVYIHPRVIMPRVKVTIQQRAESFKSDKFYVSDSKILMCGICDCRLDWEKKDTLVKHVISSNHLTKKKALLTASIPPKRQASLQLCADNQKKAKIEKETFIEDTVKMCLKANIPLNKLDHPAVREYMKTYVRGSGDLPSSNALRREHVQSCGDDMKKELEGKMKDKKIVIVADETSDCKGRCVLAILFRTVTPTVDQEVYLANCMFLDKATGSSCSQAINESLTSYNINYDNVLGLVSDSAPYMGTCFAAMNILLGEHLLHFQCWAHKVNLAGDIFMKELGQLNLLVIKAKMSFLNGRKIKSAYKKFLEDRHPELRAVLFPAPIITRWNSWFHSVVYLDKYVDAMVEFFHEYDGGLNTSSDYIVSQFEDPATAQKLKVQLKFVAEACEKFVKLINVLEGSKYPYAHLLWDELTSLSASLKRFSNGSFPAQTMEKIRDIDNLVDREEMKATLKECAQKSNVKLCNHMALGPTNNFYVAAGQLFNPAIAAATQVPNEKMVVANQKKMATFFKMSQDSFLEGYTYFHRQLVGVVRSKDEVDILQILSAMKSNHKAFAEAALQAIWAPVNSVDAERFFSKYNLVLTDKRTNMKESTVETCAMLSFNSAL